MRRLLYLSVFSIVAGSGCVAEPSYPRETGGGNGHTTGATAGHGGGPDHGGETAVGGSSGSASGGSAGSAATVPAVSFADNQFYAALNGGPIGSSSYVYAAVVRAADGVTSFADGTEVWRKGNTARGWTFARVSGGGALRFRHHDAAGVVRGTGVPITMPRLNVLVFTFDGTSQVGYLNGKAVASSSITGITPATDADDFFVPSSSSVEDVLIAELFWSNAPEGFLDEGAVAAWSSDVIATMSRGEVPEGWGGCEGHLTAADAGDTEWTDRIGGLTLTQKGTVNLVMVPAEF